MRRLLVATAVILSASSPTMGADSATEVTESPPPPLSPAESMKLMEVPEGFRVELVAAEPLIVNVISLAFDERGRIWVAETLEYPNELPKPGEERDRIKIIEDTDGDGRMDRATLFADHLNIPTSLMFADGGVVVAQAPVMLFMKDTDGDDRANVRKVIYDGWGRADTHAVCSNLRPGVDNWIYGTVGYSGAKLKLSDRTLQFGAGAYRFRASDPDSFEYLTSTGSNTWGLGLDAWGRAFISKANYDHCVYLSIPNRAFERVRGWHGSGNRVIEDHRKFHPITEAVRQVDWHGMYTSASGSTRYTAEAFPREYWNDRYVCEPTGHLVHRDLIEPEGSGFVARDGFNILASKDEWCAPIEAIVGPDGALYVVDWYSYVVRHNPTPIGYKTGPGNAYVSKHRDRKHCRIYRIVHENAPKPVRPALHKATDAELVRVLSHSNMWWRQTAQRLLIDRRAVDAQDALRKVLAGPGDGYAALHAVWTLEGLAVLRPDDIRGAMRHPRPEVRRAGATLAPRDDETFGALANLLEDGEPHVRLAALLALGERPTKGIGTKMHEMLLRPANACDRWIPLAAISVASHDVTGFLAAVLGSAPPADEKTRAALVKASEVISRHYATGEPDETLVAYLSHFATPAANRNILRAAALKGFAAGWPKDKRPTWTPALERVAAALLEHSGGEVAALAAPLLLSWDTERKLAASLGPVRQAVAKQLADTKQPEGDRIAAARTLIQLGAGIDEMYAILDQLTPQASPALQKGLIGVMAQSASPQVAEAILESWPWLMPVAREAALDVLTARTASTAALLDALDSNVVSKGDLTNNAINRLRAISDKDLRSRAIAFLEQAGRMPNPDREKLLETLLPLAQQKGDVEQGRAAFDEHCGACHRFEGNGNEIAPDLTGIGARGKTAILTDVIDPNRSVAGNYRQYAVATHEGYTYFGYVNSETATTIELINSNGVSQVIQRAEIEELQATQLSLMPEGFETIEPDALRGLLEYLTATGEYMPVRITQAANADSQKPLFVGGKADRLVFPHFGRYEVAGVPFHIADPDRNGSRNIIVLRGGPSGCLSDSYTTQTSIECNLQASKLHFLTGMAGWGYPIGKKGVPVMTVRVAYADGTTQETVLRNGEHFADYIRRHDVPGSKFVMKLRDQQLRYLAVDTRADAAITRIDLVDHDHITAPIVAAITAQRPGE